MRFASGFGLEDAAVREIYEAVCCEAQVTGGVSPTLV